VLADGINEAETCTPKSSIGRFLYIQLVNRDGGRERGNAVAAAAGGPSSLIFASFGTQRAQPTINQF
jgi:hypothetical protein